MPPDLIPQGEPRCFICDSDGKETPINLNFSTSPLLEDIANDIKDTIRKVQELNAIPKPVAVIDAKLNPKKIKEFQNELLMMMSEQQKTVEKYRNHKIHRRARMIRRANHMRKYRATIILMPNETTVLFDYGRKEVKLDG